MPDIDFIKPTRKPDLPEIFPVSDELHKMAKSKNDEIKKTILTECGIFGLNVVEAVLNQSNYVRSVKGLYLLTEAMERLQFIEFLLLQILPLHGQNYQGLPW